MTVVYDYYLSDQSPAITYSPYRDGPIAGGWNATYSGQNQVTWSQNTLGPGVSSHITTFRGATAFFNFTGTNADALGNATDFYDFDVLCNGQAVADKSKWQQGILGSCTNSTNGMQSITIVSNTSDTLSFAGFHLFTEFAASDGATAVNKSVKAAPPGARKRSLTDLGAEWYLPDTVGETADEIIEAVLAGNKRPSTHILDKRRERGTLVGRANYGDQSWQTTGEWNVNSQIGGGGGSNSSVYPRVVTSAPTSVLIFTVPSNSSFVAIIGSVDWNQGTYEVQAWPDGDHSLASQWTIFNASSRWASIEQIKCTSTLDPTRSWQVAVTNLGPSPLAYWDIASTLYVQTSDRTNLSQPPPGYGTGSSGLSGGAIAGIVVGALAGVAALLLLGFLFWRRKKKTHIVRTAGPADLGEEDKAERPTPFEPQMASTSSGYSGLPLMSPGMTSTGDARSRDSYFSGQTGKVASGAGFVAAAGGSTLGTQDLLSPSDSASRDETTSGFAGQAESSAAAVSSADSKRPRPAAARPTFRQERDAGRLPEAEVIPPEYNPEWADTGSLQQDRQ
jgi:hypothetical protein